jgi:hypothetical protein
MNAVLDTGRQQFRPAYMQSWRMKYPEGVMQVPLEVAQRRTMPSTQHQFTTHAARLGRIPDG